MAFSNSAHSIMPMAGMKKVLDNMKDDEAEEEPENEGEKKTVKKRKRVKLDKAAFQEKLVSPDGVSTLYSDFRDIKFKGKGREAEDLRLLMRKYEEWAYKLVPVLSFDDVIQKVESVGNTYFVQQALDKFREVECEKKDPRKQEELAKQAEAEKEGSEKPRDTAITSEKPQEATAAAAPAPAIDVALQDGGEDEGYDDPEAFGYDPCDDFEEDIGAEYVDEDAFEEAPRQPSPPPPEINDELRQRIERNKRLAMERLAAARTGANAAPVQSDGAAAVDEKQEGGSPMAVLPEPNGGVEWPDENSKTSSDLADAAMPAQDDGGLALGEKTTPESAEVSSVMVVDTGGEDLKAGGDLDDVTMRDAEAEVMPKEASDAPKVHSEVEDASPADGLGGTPVDTVEKKQSENQAGTSDGAGGEAGNSPAADHVGEQGDGGGDETEDEPEERGGGNDAEEDVDELELVEDFI